MNQRYAVVRNGVVTNVVMFDPEPKEGWIRSDSASIGDGWNGTSFTRPTPTPIPAPAPSTADVLSALLRKGVITEEDLKA